MLKHTIAIFTKTIDDFLTVKTFFDFTVQVIYIIYLAYSLINPTGIWYLHAALLTVSFAFLIFDIIITVKINEIRSRKPRFLRFLKKKKYKAEISKAKKTRAVGKKVNFCASHTIKLFVLISALYPIVISPDTVQPIYIISTTVMVLLWILQIIFEVLKTIIIQRKDLFIEAIKADFEFIKHPIETAKSKIKKIINPEASADDLSKERIYLDNLVEERREAKNAEKLATIEATGEKLSTWLDDKLSKLASKRGVRNQSEELSSDVVREDFSKEEENV